MNFTRGIDPKDAMKVGLDANCIEICEVRYSFVDISDESIHNILEKFESGKVEKWTEGSRDFFLNRWYFRVNHKDYDEFTDYSLINFIGMRVQYQGRYYKIKELEL